jgi:hypothetical protein
MLGMVQEATQLIRRQARRIASLEQELQAARAEADHWREEGSRREAEQAE